MPTGENMQSQQFAQFILETVAGTFNPAGQRFILKGLKGEFVPEEAWANFRPDGFNEDLWNALSREHRLYQGTVLWDFQDVWTLLDMLAGAGIVSNPGADLEQKIAALPPHGPRDLVTFTLEYGQQDNCDRCPYALLVSIDLEADRDGERVEGSFSILCQKPIAEGVPMTGAAQTGKAWSFSGGDEPAGNYQINGMAAKTTSDNLAAWQAALRATGGAFAAAVLAGTITPATGPDVNLARGKAVTLGGGATSSTGVPGILTDGNNAGAHITANGGHATVDLGAATLIDRIILRASAEDADVTISTSLTGVFAGEQTVFDAAQNPEGADVDLEFNDDPVSARYIRVTPTGGSTEIEFKELSVFNTQAEEAPAVIDLTISIPYAAGDAATPAVVGAGATIALYTAYSNGIVTIPKRIPFAPQMFSVRQADTRAGLDDAAAMDKVKLVRFGFDNLVNPVWYAEENKLTYTSHVDGEEPARTFGLRFAKSSTYAPAMISEAKQQPAVPKWREVRFRHPDGDHVFKLQMLCSASGVAPIQSAGNIRAYEFPMSSVLDDEALEFAGPDTDGASVYFISRRAEA